MPKIGMEPVRRKALILATISEIGRAGSLDVTVSQIAKSAGMSPALAHHYFGSKEQIFLSAIRYILNMYGESVRAGLMRANTPEARIRAIIDVSFAPSQFEREVIAAWLAFYVKALQSPEARRLLHVYAKRLQSNLIFDLRQIFDAATARQVAQGLASLIDGFYIRAALQEAASDRDKASAMVNDYLDLWLERKNHHVQTA
ncbi:transcriptional regulator BetI [Breoghania sp. L-A4]|uniref:transcriptional regulator BetI n=1 Tax=Breoghania sp. L-A4 TaxID=2304600 RepID=UPI000E360BC0|nr:transcriptional regulator BetI [Breoghania sp. L-A4]AXS42204.1 transcriptional regulator BetI [Breoghania sp. L-A4]